MQDQRCLVSWLSYHPRGNGQSRYEMTRSCEQQTRVAIQIMTPPVESPRSQTAAAGADWQQSPPEVHMQPGRDDHRVPPQLIPYGGSVISVRIEPPHPKLLRRRPTGYRRTQERAAGLEYTKSGIAIQ